MKSHEHSPELRQTRVFLPERFAFPACSFGATSLVVSPLVLIRQYNFFPDGHNIQKRCENFLKFQSYYNPTIKRSVDAIIIFSKH
jgi:hypothetical protein